MDGNEESLRKKPEKEVNDDVHDEESNQEAVDAEMREFLLSKGFMKSIIDASDSNQLLVYYMQTKNM